MNLRELDLRGLAIRGVLVILLAALVGAAAYVFSSRQPERFETSIRLSFAAGSDLQVLGIVNQTDNKVRLNTEATALESRDLAERTRRTIPDLGLSTDDVAADVTAAPQADSQIITLTALGTTAARAAQLLAAYRDVYLRTREQSERRSAQAATRALRARLLALPKGQRTGALASSLRSQIGALAVVERSGGNVPTPIEDVTRPTEPTAPRTGRNVLFGLLFGLALGIALVAALPRRTVEVDAQAAEAAEPAPPPQIRPSSASSSRPRKASGEKR